MPKVSLEGLSKELNCTKECLWHSRDGVDVLRRLNIKPHSKIKSPIFLLPGINYCGDINSESHSLCIRTGNFT